MPNISENVSKFLELSKQYCVTFVCVTKTQTIDKVLKAYEGGARHFGENYVQEGVAKIKQIKLKDATWHMIGHVQSNKAKLVAENFDWVDTVDSLKLLEKLSRYRGETPLNVLIEVNIDNEPSKSGVSVDEYVSLLEEIKTHSFDNIIVRGLMVIPSKDNADAFVRASKLFEDGKNIFETFDTLSMGMSGDYMSAIENGSTMIRIGTSVFGARH